VKEETSEAIKIVETEVRDSKFTAGV
jgi:hypothetical protein